jgi:hypothetical protein
MRLVLEGTNEDCPFNWSLATPVVQNESFSKLSIPTTIKCNIKGVLEQLVIFFPTSAPIRDIQGNRLTTNMLRASLQRRAYISQDQAAVVATTGTAMACSTLVTFLISIIPALLQYRA